MPNFLSKCFYLAGLAKGLWLLGLLACATPLNIAPDSSFTDEVNLARRIINNSRAFTVTEDNYALLLAWLQAANPYALEERPQPPVNLSPLGLDSFQQELARYNVRQQSGIDGAALMRQAAVRLLGLNPSFDTFVLLRNLLFDEAAAVRTESLNVMLRATGEAIPILMEVLEDNELNDPERNAIIRHLANLRAEGEEALLTLLASFDSRNAEQAALALVILHPNYPNSILTALTNSSDSNERFKAPFWLMLYQNNLALYQLLTLTADSDIYTRERAIAGYGSLGRWVLEPSLAFLQADSFPHSRELIIAKLAENSMPAAIPFLHELFASNNPGMRLAAAIYADNYGLSFLNEARTLFSHPNALVRLAAINFALRFNNNQTVSYALPLLADPNAEVRAATITLVESSFPANETVLLNYFSAARAGASDNLILNLFISHGRTAFLFEGGSYNFEAVYYLLRTITSEEAWSNYLTATRNNRIQLDLNSFRRLFVGATNYRNSLAGYQTNPLVSEALAISALQLQLNLAIAAEQANFRELIQSPANPLASNNQHIRQLQTTIAQRSAAWRQLASQQTALQAGYRNFFNDRAALFNNFLAIRAENRTLAGRLLASFNINADELIAFNNLNLRI
ncbi:MAG: hypothetical protein FWE37_08310 [Spirochaetaceae bacterium]|nr:hypothetical protein [Spirochaetaceae bacterium]